MVATGLETLARVCAQERIPPELSEALLTESDIGLAATEIVQQLSGAAEPRRTWGTTSSHEV